MPIVKMAAKILVCGDVSGRWATLMKVVASATAKAGPFDALFAVGTFFAKDGAAELEPYLNGQLAVPLPTYIIAGDEPDSPPVPLPNDGCELCPNLHYLGRQGVSEIAGLTIAFLSGVYKSATDYAAARTSVLSGSYDSCCASCVQFQSFVSECAQVQYLWFADGSTNKKQTARVTYIQFCLLL